MPRDRSLPRGLDVIFQDNSFRDEETANESDKGGESIQISKIDTNPSQPRKSFDAESLEGLAQSITNYGVLQPIIVREKEGRYEIVAGERRYRAARLAGLTEIPAIVIKADDLNSAEMALVENLQREDINAFEEATAIKALMDGFDLTQEEIAEKLGKARSSVANTLRLLELPEGVIKHLLKNELTPGHCRALLGLKDKELIEKVADKIVENGTSVRDTEKIVKSMNRQRPEKKIDTEDIKIDYMGELERQFTKLTGRRCKITAKSGTKFINIEYRDEDDLEELIRRISGQELSSQL